MKEDNTHYAGLSRQKTIGSSNRDTLAALLFRKPLS